MEDKIEWNGAGTPPAGTLCEMTHEGMPGEWAVVFVVGFTQGCMHMAIQSNHEMFRDSGGLAFIYDLGSVRLRPIRTPKQIAAEEREQAVGAMLNVWRRTLGRFAEEEKGLAEMLYDAGYRKPE